MTREETKQKLATIVEELRAIWQDQYKRAIAAEGSPVAARAGENSGLILAAYFLLQRAMRL